MKIFYYTENFYKNLREVIKEIGRESTTPKITEVIGLILFILIIIMFILGILGIIDLPAVDPEMPDGSGYFGP